MTAPIETDKPKHEATDVTSARKNQDSRRLESWKEIAAYLNRSTRCAQRWEKNLKLPVHRIRHIEGHTVYAYVTELEVWRESRELLPSSERQRTDARTPTALPEPSSPIPRFSLWSVPVLQFCRVFLGRVSSR